MKVSIIERGQQSDGVGARDRSTKSIFLICKGFLELFLLMKPQPRPEAKTSIGNIFVSFLE